MKNRSRVHRSRDWLYYTRETTRKIVLLSASDSTLENGFYFISKAQRIVVVVIVVGDARDET